MAIVTVCCTHPDTRHGAERWVTQEVYMNKSGTNVTNLGKANSADHIRKSVLNSAGPGAKASRHEPYAAGHASAAGADGLAPHEHQGAPGVEGVKGKWKQLIGAAKIAWGKLTDDELLKSEGHQQKLAGLIQERYAITHDEAHNQVKVFLEKHQS